MGKMAERLPNLGRLISAADRVFLKHQDATERLDLLKHLLANRRGPAIAFNRVKADFEWRLNQALSSLSWRVRDLEDDVNAEVAVFAAADVVLRHSWLSSLSKQSLATAFWLVTHSTRSFADLYNRAQRPPSHEHEQMLQKALEAVNRTYALCAHGSLPNHPPAELMAPHDELMRYNALAGSIRRRVLVFQEHGDMWTVVRFLMQNHLEFVVGTERWSWLQELDMSYPRDFCDALCTAFPHAAARFRAERDAMDTVIAWRNYVQDTTQNVPSPANILQWQRQRRHSGGLWHRHNADAATAALAWLDRFFNAGNSNEAAVVGALELLFETGRDGYMSKAVAVARRFEI